MAGLIGQLARRVGLYGPARSLKVRLDRLKPDYTRHSREMAAFYAQFVKPGSLVFDVGANVGNRCEVFLGLGARVVAVEPQPICQDVLKRLFGRDPRFTLVPMALGEAPQSATMYLADMSGLSTLSTDWIEKTKTSGRFGGHDWQETITVPVTTLDALIAEHGTPEFCKIDVEGYELHVLSGLTRAIPAVSFELAAEAAENALQCITRLESLGSYEYNSSNSESMKLERADWVSGPQMKDIVGTRLAPQYFGDVYARLTLTATEGPGIV